MRISLYPDFRFFIQNFYKLFYKFFVFDRINLPLYFICCLFIITLTPFFERLVIIGKPNLSWLRFGLSASILIFELFYLVHKKIKIQFKKRYFFPVIVFYAINIYITLISIYLGDKLIDVIFYWLYCNFIFLGIYYSKNYVRELESCIIILNIIAIGVGFLMFVVGQDKLQSMGIGAVEGKWGQYLTTDSVDGALDLLYFRVFSIFFDHQGFSAFLQLSAFYFRIRYEATKRKEYVYWIIFLLVGNSLTYSSTGFIIIALILLSIIRTSRVAIVGGIIVSVLYGWYLLFPEFFQVLFHIGSLNMRYDFVLATLSHITWSPHLQTNSTDFSSDCLILWNSYRYGLLYLILQSIFFLAFIYNTRFSKNTQKLMVFFCLIYLINILSNGLYLSSPTNTIMFPILLGMTLAYEDSGEYSYSSYNKKLFKFDKT